MNCANHPDISVSAYCQNCGKPLCSQCVRSVAGVVYCEPCLAARLQPGSPSTGAPRPSAGGAAAAGWSPVSNPAGGSAAPFVSATPYPGAPGGFGPGASPVLAGLLGTIPGVGAMYNGQFIKALVHVLVFIVLIGLTDHFALAGLLIAAWVFYQIFDAIQTAIARRNGQPLLDPFGLNDLGARLGMPAGPGPAYAAAPPASASGFHPGPGPSQAPGGFAPSQPPPPSAGQAAYDDWVVRAATEKALRDAGIPVGQSGPQPGYTSVPPPPGAYQSVYPLAPQGRPEPVGAVVLIVVGTLFLLSTLGIFRLHWLGHGWPILIIILGAWLLFSRLRGGPRPGGGL